MTFTHIDLFTGIGGFRIAAEEVWKDDYENICMCDIDPFCQALLKLRFPRSKIYGDIADLIRDTGNGFGRVDLITGGFPCQPFSQAGKRRGKDDKRFLWPAMFQVIKNTKPRWIIAENVSGILSIEGGMVFEQVCTDLETEGYEVRPFIIPAIAKNAPHRRDRVWIVARDIRNTGDEGKSAEKSKLPEIAESTRSDRCFEYNAELWDRRFSGVGKGNSNAPDTKETDRYTECLDVEGVRKQQDSQRQDRLQYRENEGWSQNWIEIATELCRMDDELPAELDGFKLSKSKHREERLKSLGNAIVPAVAVEIMKAIREADKSI